MDEDLTEDLYDLKGCITGGSSHVDTTIDEQCGHATPATGTYHPRERASPHMTVMWDRESIVIRQGYLSVPPKMHYAARPAECSSTLLLSLLLFIIIIILFRTSISMNDVGTDDRHS